MTRQDLYDLVWSMPMTHAAKKFGISDFALAKNCRGANVPVPERGYWARKQAGKRVSQIPLPPRGLGMSDAVGVSLRGSLAGGGCPTIKVDAPPPEPPLFPETLDSVRDHIRKTMGKVVVPREGTRTHAAILGLKAADDHRRTKRAASPYPGLYDAPLFDDAVGKRRLRLLNAIFLAVTKVGASATTGRGKSLETAIVVGHQSVSFRLDVNSAFDRDHRGGGMRRKRSGDPDAMRLDVLATAWEAGSRFTWLDDGDGKLESRLLDIAVELVVTGEAQHRERAVGAYEWNLKRRAAILEERRLAAIRAEKEERERRERLEKERIDRLLGEARALREADEIRAYVAAVRERATPAGNIDRWASWTLAQADRLDPIATGRIILGENEG